LEFAIEAPMFNPLWHVDHVVPQAAGGGNTDVFGQPNLVAACIPCNLLKGPLDEAGFRLKLEQRIAQYQAFIDRYMPVVENLEAGVV
jgi:hypothetical protein